MSSFSHPLLGDVSCRATCHTIEQLRRLGLPTDHVTAGLKHRLEDLSKPSNSIPWDDFLRFAENSRIGLSADQIVELCVTYKSSPALRPLLTAAGMWYHPARYYSWICDSESGAIRQLFRCISAKFNQISDREVTLELTIRPDFTLPPDFFWETQGLAYGALTTYFGLPSSLVTWEKIDRGVIFHVTLPRKRPFRYLLSWIGSFFRNESAEDLRNAIKYGNERSVRLEIEILERNRAEAALLESDRRFRQVADSIPGVVYRFVMTPEGKDMVTHISAGIKELTGYTPAEVIKDFSRMWNAIHPADLTGFQDSLAASASGRKPWSREYRMVALDGSVRWVRSRATAEPSDGSGSIVWNGVLLDVTAERMASEALRESEERWKFALQGSGAGVIEFEIATGRMFYSEQWRKMTGYAPGMLSEDVEALKAIIHPEDLVCASAALEATISGKQHLLQVEHRIRRADGTWIWIEARGLITSRGEGGVARRLTGTHTDISKRKSIEEKLRANDLLLQKLTLQVPGMIFQFQSWPDGRSCVPYASEGIREIYELNPEEVKQSAEKIFRLTHPDDMVANTESILESERTLQPWHCYCRIILPKKGLRWVEGHSIPERMPDGSTLWHGHISDVTNRKKAEDSLRESEDRLSAVIRNAPNVAIQWFDAEGRIELWNEAAESLFGYSSEEALGRKLDELLLTSEQASDFRNSIEFVRRSGQPVGPTEFGFRRRDGRQGVCLSSLFKIPGDGACERFVCMDVDITDRKEAEAALRQSTKRLALAVGATSDAIWEWNYLTGETYYSLRWYEMVGCDTSLPMMFDTFKSLCHPDDFEPLIAKIRVTLDSPHSIGYEAEFRMKHAAGHWVWIQGRGNVVERDRDGHPRLLAGTNTDITERKRIDAELRASRDRLDFLVSATPAVIYTAKPEGIFPNTFISENVKARFGYESRQFLESPTFWSEQIHPEDAPRIADEFNQLFEKGNLNSEFRLRISDGSYRWIQDQSVLIRDSESKPVEIVGYVVDVTDKKLAELALRESEERQRLAIEAARLGSWRYLPKTDEVELDERAAQFLGFNASVINSLELRERLFSEDFDSLVALASESIGTESDGTFETEFRVAHPSGKTRWLALRGRAIRLTELSAPRPEFFLGTLQDITERKQSEQQLRLSEFALSRASVGAAIISPDARFLQVNRTYCKLLGRTAEELLKLRVYEVNPEYSLERWPQHWEELREKKILRFESLLRHSDGHDVPAEIEINYLEFEGVEYNFAFIRDITERKKTDAQLRLSEFALESASLGASIIGSDARFWKVNQADRLLSGYEPEEMLRMTVHDINPDFPASKWPAHWQELRNKKHLRFETRFRHKSGRIFPVEIESNYLEFEGIEYNFAFARDITERKKNEDAIRASEARLSEAQRIGRVGSWEMNAITGEVWCSDMMYELFGVKDDQIPHHFEAFISLVHPDDVDECFALMRPVLSGETDDFVNEFRVIRPDGQTIWISSRGRSTKDASGKVLLIRGTDHDITERKKAEETLRSSEQRLRSLVSSLAEGITFQDLDGKILDCNVSAEHVLGLTREQILGRTSIDPLWQCIHVDGTPFPGEDHPAMVTLRTGKRCAEVIMGVRKPDRTLTWISINSEPLVREQDLQLFGVICSFSDITDRKRSEDALRESEARLQLALSAAKASAFVWNIKRDEVIRYQDIDGALIANPDKPDSINVVRGRVHPEDLAEFDFNLAKCLRGESDYHNLYRLVRPGLPLVWLEQSGLLERNPDGTPIRLTGVSINVTERKNAEFALRESEARLRLALAAAATFAFVWDARTDRLIRYFSNDPRFPVNTDRPEVIADVRSRVHPDDREQFDTILLSCLERGNEYRNLYRFLLPEDVTIWLEVWGTLERDINGRPISLTGIAIDVTARIRAEQEIRESEIRYRSLIETSSDGIFLLSLDGRILSANSAAARMHGYTVEELLRMRMQQLDLPEVAAKLPERMIRLRDGETLNFEATHIRKDGTTFPVEVVASAVEIGGEWLVLAYDRDITERKNAERKLRDSEIRYRTFIETCSDGVLLLGQHGEIRAANRAGAHSNGYTVDEMLQMNIKDIDVSDDPDAVAQRIKRLRAGESLTFEVIHRRKDGSLFPLEVSASAVEIDNEWLVIAFERDITARRQAEAALRDSEHRQRIALDAGRMGTWEWEVGSDRLNWDEREERLFGFEPGEFDGKLRTFLERIVEEDRYVVKEGMKIAERGGNFDGEFRVRLPNGEIRWIRESGAFVPPSEHSNRRIIGINYDVTDRKAAEQTLVEEKSLLQALFSSLPGIVFAFDQTGKYVRWNHSYETLLGWSDEDMANMSALDTVVPRDRDRISHVIREVFEKGESTTEIHTLGKDGREIPLYCSGVRSILGGKPCLIGFGIDISARLAAEKALRLSEFRLLQAQKIASLGYWEADFETGLTWWSDEEYRIFGQSPETFVPSSESFMALIHPEDREIHKAALNQILQTGGVQATRFRIVRPDGAIRYVYEEARIEPRAGAAPFLRGVTKDVTEQAVADLALRASLREKEAMIKEIHHRVKNNLQVISSLLSLQSARVANQVARDVLVESQNRVRAMALVHETLYRSEDLAFVDLSRYLGELCGYLFRGYGVDSGRIRLEMDIDPVTIPLDKTIPCGLIVNEIISNSLKYAFPADRPGTILVRVRATNGLIDLTLADDGIGLPADFDVDQSPSLGLQLVNILADQLGGRVNWDRSVGARMMISFSP